MTIVIDAVIGDDVYQTFNITEDGAAKDVSSYTITFSVTDELSDLTAIIQKTDSSGIDMTDAATGTIIVELTQTDTKSMEVGNYHFDLKFELAGKVSTWAIGTMSFTEPAWLETA